MDICVIGMSGTMIKLDQFMFYLGGAVSARVFPLDFQYEEGYNNLGYLAPDTKINTQGLYEFIVFNDCIYLQSSEIEVFGNCCLSQRLLH